LKKKHIHIARAGHHIQFPAEFQLICAMNPCPCGYSTHPHISCQCTPHAIQRYQTRISGPLLDRIGLHVHLNSPAHNTPPSTDEAVLSIKHIQTLREAQQQRQGCLNHQLNTAHPILKQNTSSKAHTMLSNIYQKQHLSMRALGHLHTTAFTIADISDSPHISVQHIEQALMFQKNITHKHATPHAI
jgi:magnesium chelatase family protein